MPLESPIRFDEALLSREVRRLMPTNLSSAELQELGAEVMERAITSARTTNAFYLGEIEKRVRKILEPVTVATEAERVAEGMAELRTEGLDRASARTELKEILREIGYGPEPGEEGTIKDLSSDARLNLVIDTNVEMAQGYGQWAQGQDADVIELWPAQELFRAEDRNEERRWREVIWPEAARAVGDMGALRALAKGRMVARKDSPIWIEISDFGQPYPPFKFNSGMDVMDVSREEAIELGVIAGGEMVTPQSRSFAREE